MATRRTTVSLKVKASSTRVGPLCILTPSSKGAAGPRRRGGGPRRSSVRSGPSGPLRRSGATLGTGAGSDGRDARAGTCVARTRAGRGRGDLRSALAHHRRLSHRPGRGPQPHEPRPIRPAQALPASGRPSRSSSGCTAAATSRATSRSRWPPRSRCSPSAAGSSRASTTGCSRPAAGNARYPDHYDDVAAAVAWLQEARGAARRRPEADRLARALRGRRHRQQRGRQPGLPEEAAASRFERCAASRRSTPPASTSRAPARGSRCSGGWRCRTCRTT